MYRMQELKEDDLSQIDALFFVTIPRSAYHLLAKRINFYFNDALRADEASRYTYKHLREAETRPCQLIGTHDFGLNRKWPSRLFRTTPCLEGRKYLIQIRNPIPGSISHFRLEEKNGLKRKGTEKEWIEHSTRHFAFVRRFIRRWIVEPPYSTGMAISYEQITNEPLSTLRDALRLMAKDGLEPNESKVQACIDRYPFIDPPSLEEFEYYDKGHFRRLRDSLKETIAILERPEFQINLDLP